MDSEEQSLSSAKPLSLGNTMEAEEKLSGNEKQLVVFNLAEEEYAIEIHKTREIIEKPEITKIPNSPSFIAGLINIRGKIVSIIDLGEKFNLKNSIGKQILVTEMNGEQFGLLIDKVVEINKVNEKFIKKAPSILSEKIHLDYLTGVAVLEKRLIIILNIENILSEEDLKKSIEKKTSTSTETKEDVNAATEEDAQKLAEELDKKDQKVEVKEPQTGETAPTEPASTESPATQTEGSPEETPKPTDPTPETTAAA